LVFKIADKFTSGIPDLLICFDGRFLAIELKVHGNTATAIQQHQLDRIRKAGGRTAICHSVAEVKQFIKEVI
jgi:hypothetical protein